MTNAEIKELLDWFFPRKIKTRVLRLGERLRNYCCNDQSLFQILKIAVGFMFILSVFIPYFKILPSPSEIQPNAFLLGLILLIIWRKIYFSKEFYLLLFTTFASVFILPMNTFTLVHIRDLYGYFSFFILSLASYNYFLYFGEIKYIFYRNVLLAYMIVGLIQMYMDPNFFHLFLARESGYNGQGGRGFESMATEPTYYGLILIFIFILIYNSFTISPSKKIKLYALILISILFISRSATALVGFFIFLFFYFAKIDIKNIFCFLLFGLIGIGSICFYSEEIQHMRVFRLLELLYNGGVSELIGHDISSKNRVLHVFYSLKGFADNLFLPNGYSFWDEYIQLQDSLGYDVRHIGHKPNKIISFFGVILFELGILGFPMVFYIFYILKKRFNVGKYIAHTTLFIFVLFQSLTVAYTLIPFVFSFFLYQIKANSTHKYNKQHPARHPPQKTGTQK